jgi:hypothetical protein
MPSAAPGRTAQFPATVELHADFVVCHAGEVLAKGIDLLV